MFLTVLLLFVAVTRLVVCLFDLHFAGYGYSGFLKNRKRRTAELMTNKHHKKRFISCWIHQI